MEMFLFINMFLSVCAFGTWMADVHNDKSDGHPDSLTWLNWLMLAFCCVDIFLVFCARRQLPRNRCGGFHRYVRVLRAFVYLALVVLAFLSSKKQDSTFLMTGWYKGLFSAIALDSFLTGPCMVLDWLYHKLRICCI